MRCVDHRSLEPRLDKNPDFRTASPRMKSCLLRLGVALFLACSGMISFGQSISAIPSENEPGISKAVIVNNVPLAHTAQMLPVNQKGELVGKGNLSAQIDQIFKNLTLASSASVKPPQFVKINVYLARPEFAAQARKILSKKFSNPKEKSAGTTPPAISFVAGDLPLPEAMVAMDAILVASGQFSFVKRSGMGNTTTGAVLPTNGVVYISGQADKGELPEATQKTLAKLKDTLDFLGLAKQDVVQCKAFMSPMTGVDAVKKEFEKFFTGQAVPPLVFVDWISKEYPIEIETIVAGKPAPESAPQMEFLTPPGATASPVYAKVVKVNRGKLVFVSGLYGAAMDNAESEITEIYSSLEDALKKAGSDLKHLAKATYYVSNSQTSGKLNDLRPKYYDPKSPPAASKATVKDVGMVGKGITLDMIGVVSEPQEKAKAEK
jgi:enamine deaminase RidA (YjgF/YER057c/UK114 family)